MGGESFWDKLRRLRVRRVKFRIEFLKKLYGSLLPKDVSAEEEAT
ncbi:hypothetical protein [Thermofilum pendens]|nr:hypothetical protein [Thermofilum pendens]